MHCLEVIRKVNEERGRVEVVEKYILNPGRKARAALANFLHEIRHGRHYEETHNINPQAATKIVAR